MPRAWIALLPLLLWRSGPVRGVEGGNAGRNLSPVRGPILARQLYRVPWRAGPKGDLSLVTQKSLLSRRRQRAGVVPASRTKACCISYVIGRKAANAQGRRAARRERNRRALRHGSPPGLTGRKG